MLQKEQRRRTTLIAILAAIAIFLVIILFVVLSGAFRDDSPTEAELTAAAEALIGLSPGNPAQDTVTFDQMQLTITAVERPADPSTFPVAPAREPAENEEFISVSVQVLCLAENGTCMLSERQDFSMSGQQSGTLSEAVVVDTNSLLNNAEWLGGATINGTLYFIAPEGETVILRWAGNNTSEQFRYLAIQPPIIPTATPEPTETPAPLVATFTPEGAE